MWLQQALAEVGRGQMNEVEQMKQCLVVLRQDGPSERDGEDREEEDDNEQETAFEILSDLCENLDNARGGKNLSSSIRDFLAELQIRWAPFVPFTNHALYFSASQTWWFWVDSTFASPSTCVMIRVDWGGAPPTSLLPVHRICHKCRFTCLALGLFRNCWSWQSQTRTPLSE